MNLTLMETRKIILMYHSVSGPNHPAIAGSFPISMERFKAQILGALDKGWEIKPLSNLRDPLRPNSKALFVTGDDGTIDWVANVLPWCDDNNIPTHTAIITGPWMDPPVYPVAHRLQNLLVMPGKELPLPELSVEQRDYIDRVYSYETDPKRRYLKGACNVIFDDATARNLLGQMDDSEREAMGSRFAPPIMYKQLENAEFGVHTHSHTAFAGDAELYFKEEIEFCEATMKDHDLLVSQYFTLPMRPRHPATIEQLVPVLRGRGYAGVLDGQGFWDGESFVIPRIDAKNVEKVLDLKPWNQE